MKKPPTKIDVRTIWAEAFPIYFALKNRVVRLKFNLATDDELAGLVSPKDIRAWQRKMTRKSYVLAWSKTHKKNPAQKLAAKLKRCGVSRDV